jgi:hypothetical protein
MRERGAVVGSLPSTRFLSAMPRATRSRSLTEDPFSYAEAVSITCWIRSSHWILAPFRAAGNIKIHGANRLFARIKSKSQAGSKHAPKCRTPEKGTFYFFDSAQIGRGTEKRSRCLEPHVPALIEAHGVSATVAPLLPTPPRLRRERDMESFVWRE